MYKTTDGKTLILHGAVAAALLVTAFVFTEKVTEGASQGIGFCVNVLVPSLFPFMFIASFAAQSGACSALGKLLKKPTRALFGLSGEFAAVIIMSVIGGYPVGAGMIAKLFSEKRITEYEARRAAYFSVASGAGFMVTFIGARLLRSVEAGLCVYAAQICSVLITGIAGRFIFRNKYSKNHDSGDSTFPPLSQAVVDSAAAATKNVIEMCGIVVLFSSFISVIKSFWDSAAVSVALEVTRAVSELSQTHSVVLIGFAAGFGGLCVHFQIFRLLREIRINKAVFFLYRIIQGIITALLTKVFVGITGVSIPVFSSMSSPPARSLSATALGSALLIATGICFLFSLANNIERS